jgi:peptidoglycan biosynthesis protein MviN/MurJ (putative lipid II flippase)
VIVEALTNMSVNAYLLIPVLATGFAAGCSVGSTMSPGLLWIYSRLRG